MLLLKAKEENWGLIMPGRWTETIWKIHSGGSYTITKYFQEIDEQRRKFEIKFSAKGKLSPDKFQKLKDALNSEWSTEQRRFCDGVAWEFELYEHDKIIKHRPLGYIYGIEPYETIAYFLPSDEGIENNRE